MLGGADMQDLWNVRRLTPPVGKERKSSAPGGGPDLSFGLVGNTAALNRDPRSTAGAAEQQRSRFARSDGRRVGGRHGGAGGWASGVGGSGPGAVRRAARGDVSGLAATMPAPNGGSRGMPPAAGPFGQSQQLQQQQRFNLADGLTKDRRRLAGSSSNAAVDRLRARAEALPGGKQRILAAAAARRNSKPLDTPSPPESPPSDAETDATPLLVAGPARKPLLAVELEPEPEQELPAKAAAQPLQLQDPRQVGNGDEESSPADSAPSSPGSTAASDLFASVNTGAGRRQARTRPAAYRPIKPEALPGPKPVQNKAEVVGTAADSVKTTLQMQVELSRGETVTEPPTVDDKQKILDKIAGETVTYGESDKNRAAKDEVAEEEQQEQDGDGTSSSRLQETQEKTDSTTATPTDSQDKAKEMDKEKGVSAQAEITVESSGVISCMSRKGPISGVLRLGDSGSCTVDFHVGERQNKLVTTMGQKKKLEERNFLVNPYEYSGCTTMQCMERSKVTLIDLAKEVAAEVTMGTGWYAQIR